MNDEVRDSSWQSIFQAKREWLAREQIQRAPVPLDTIELLVLEWAKRQYPDKYAATLAVISQPRTYRRYLIRLIEIRWGEDTSAWRNEIPLRVLEESAVTMQVIHRPTEKQIMVGGRLARTPLPDVSFGMLFIALMADDPSMALSMMLTANEQFDLALPDKPSPSPVT